MADPKNTETEEEARERVAAVRATQIFGDTPTDPTIGDVVVPAHDQEGATANVAAADADEDTDVAPEEAARAAEVNQFSEEDVEEANEESDDDDSDDGVLGSSDDSADTTEDTDDDELSREEKIEAIKSADSVEEVDRLAEGDERVTVKRAADERKEELSA